jgi:hypothetical protein
MKIHEVEAALGEQLIVWVDPSSLTHYVVGKPLTRNRQRWLKKVFTRLPSAAGYQRSDSVARRTYEYLYNRVTRAEPFIIPADHYPTPTSVFTHKKYVKIRDLIDHQHNVKGSSWYRQLVSTLEITGVARHKRHPMQSEQAIVEFLEGYVADLVGSMAREGYRLDKGGDIGKAIIDENGCLQKAGSGDHRFFTARVLGVDRVPLKIDGVHATWAERILGSRSRVDLDSLTAAIRRLDLTHPREVEATPRVREPESQIDHTAQLGPALN